MRHEVATTSPITPLCQAQLTPSRLIETRATPSYPHYLLSTLPARRRPHRRRILIRFPVVTRAIHRLRRLHLHIVASIVITRGAVRRRVRIVRAIRVVVVVGHRRLLLLRARVVGCLSVAWRCAAEGPAGAAVGLVAHLSSAAGCEAAVGAWAVSGCPGWRGVWFGRLTRRGRRLGLRRG